MRKYLLTQETTIKHLRPLFRDLSKDSITIQEMYVNAGRNLVEKKKNRTWYKNQIMYFRQHDFIKAQYNKKNGKDIVVGIELTERGKIALGRIKGELKPIPEVSTPTEESKHLIKQEFKNNENQNTNVNVVIQVMTRLKTDNPNQKIVYDINGGTISIQ